MDVVLDYLKDLYNGGSSYGIAALFILLWWIGRSFTRLYHQAAGGPNATKQPAEQDRPRRRLPLQ